VKEQTWATCGGRRSVNVIREFHQWAFSALRFTRVQANAAIEKVYWLHSQVEQSAFSEAEGICRGQQSARPKLRGMLGRSVVRGFLNKTSPRRASFR